MSPCTRAGAALVVALALATTACTASSDEAETTAQPSDERATVVWVVDGDTVRLEDGRVVRLLQVDAPEADECYGRGATRALIALVKDRTVTLERDASLDERDRYDRLLRYLVVDGRNVNVQLVERGAAMPYLFRNERGRYANALLTAAQAARSGETGLWAACPRARLEPGLGSITGDASTER